MKEYLQETGLSADVTSSPATAWEAASPAAWDAIVVDVDRLGPFGTPVETHAEEPDPGDIETQLFDLVSHWRERAPASPVILLAAPDTLHAAEAALQAGATEVLRKSTLTPALAEHAVRWAIEKVQMRRQLRHRDQWLRSLTEQLSDGIFRSTPETGVVYANKRLVDLLGFKSEEALSRAPPDTIYVDPSERERILQTARDQGEVNEAEVWLQKAGGSAFRALISCTLIQGKENSAVFLDGVVTEAPKSDDPRGRGRDREPELYKSALDHCFFPVLIMEARPLDAPGPRIVYANDAFELMSGYAQEELRGRSPRFLQGPETDRDVFDDLRSSLEQGEPWSGQTINYRKDGSTYPVAWHTAPVRNDNGDIEHWISVQSDLTRPSEQRSRRPESVDSTEQIAPLKSSILHNLSHELRTPLTAMNGFADILKEELCAPHDRMAERIRSSGQRLQKTIDAVLSLSDLEASDFSLPREPVDLTSVVRGVVEDLQPKIRQGQVEVSLDMAKGGLYSRLNRGAVERIATCLLENAVKFTPEGGTIAVRVHSSKDGDVHFLEVEDTGIGIDEEFLPRLFDPFAQESQGMTCKYDGLGLGLSIADRLVERLEGSIEVETEKGVGTRFTVSFPAS